MTPVAQALDRCLRLMSRGAPHPDDAEAWHRTQVEAAKLLAREGDRPRGGAVAALRFFALPIVLGTLIGLFLCLLKGL